MDHCALSWLALAVVFVWAVLGLLKRWWQRRFVKNTLESEPGNDLSSQPEGRYFVTFSESEVVCTRPDGRVESVAWQDLQRVELVTSDEGPFAPDVFWVLYGSQKGCVIPLGVSGEPELLQRLQQMPGFRNAMVIQAMSSTGPGRFVCWQKGADSEGDVAPVQDTT